jgi:hypothetical protein
VAVRAHRRERVVDVGHRQHTRQLGQLLGHEPAAVAAAVQALVVRGAREREPFSGFAYGLAMLPCR